MKKALGIIRTVVTWVVLAAAVFMMVFTILSVSTFDRKDRGIFGYNMFVVLSDSMKATDFAAGDLVVSKKLDFKDPDDMEELKKLKEGDIITFQSTNTESKGEYVTHKIRKLTTDEYGNPGFVTYGTTTGTDDEAIVLYSHVVGKYQFRLAGVGKFFQFLKTMPGYIICILIPFLTLILIQGYNSIRLFKRYKGEQMEALNAEKAQIEAERQESKKMMEELMALRAQLGGQNPEQKPAEPTEPANPADPAVTAEPAKTESEPAEDTLTESTGEANETAEADNSSAGSDEQSEVEESENADESSRNHG